MSTNCDTCGYRDNEIKSGGAISEKGKRITVKVEDREDLSRDILKVSLQPEHDVTILTTRNQSETAGLTIPEIDLVLSHGTLGGRFTTLEGILQQVHEELAEKVFMSGDSSSAKDKAAFAAFLKNLQQVREVHQQPSSCLYLQLPLCLCLSKVKAAEVPFTIILDDPLSNSYIQNPYAPDPDPNMTIESYERSWQQNEDLGLNDIKIEGYEVEYIEKEIVS